MMMSLKVWRTSSRRGRNFWVSYPETYATTGALAATGYSTSTGQNFSHLPRRASSRLRTTASQAGVNSRPSQKDIKLATRPWSAAGSTSWPRASDNSHINSSARRQSATGPRASSSRAAVGDESFVFGGGSLLPARFVGKAHLRVTDTLSSAAWRVDCVRRRRTAPTSRSHQGRLHAVAAKRRTPRATRPSGSAFRRGFRARPRCAASV